MPGSLKSLELQGYKTFANRTVFEFSDQITAIVGPNGSGKSNIADSMRWVLGEQSYSLLRGKKTEDMIFSGSELRPRAGMAAASITFDNSDGWLPIDFSEVAITRRAYRDGTNEYLINGQRVRLKDVSELLAQSGLAERTYTIIGQGLVDVALALKAEDRRRLFEEAAGIGLYRSRREEALRRLDTTRRNLERVDDILTELEPRLRSLEKQARRAQEFEQVKADLQVLLRDWYGYHWHRAQKDLIEAREIERTHALALEKVRAEQQLVEQELINLRQGIQNQRARLTDWLHQSTALHGRRENLTRSLAVYDERSHSLEQLFRNATVEQEHLGEDIQLQQSLLNSVQQEIMRLSDDLSESQARVSEANIAYAERQSERSVLEKQIQELAKISGGLNARRGELMAKVTERSAQVGRDQKGIDQADQAIMQTEIVHAQASQRLKDAQTQFGQAENALRAAGENLQTIRGNLENVEKSLSQLLMDRTNLSAHLERNKARLEVLEQAEASLSGYAEGTRHLLQAIRQNRLLGKSGALSQYLDVPVELEPAIGAALGEFLEAVLLETDPDNAFEELEEQTGRAALLPYDQLQFYTPLVPEAFGVDPRAILGTGWIGLASELVVTTSDLRQVVDVLLGSAWLVSDRQAARSLLRSRALMENENPLIERLRIFTLQGDCFFMNGAILTGQQPGEQERSTLLNRHRQRNELQHDQADIAEQVAVLDQQNLELEQSRTALIQETDRLDQQYRDFSRQRQHVELEMHQARLAVEQADSQARWHLDQRKRLQEQIDLAEQDILSSNAAIGDLDLEIARVRDKARELNSTLNGMSLDEFQLQLAHWTTRQAVIERALADEQRRLDEREQALAKMEAQRHTLAARLEELSQARHVLLEEKRLAQVEESQVGRDIADMQARIQPSESELSQLEVKQSLLEEREVAARQAVSLADHRHSQTRLEFSRRQETLLSLQRRIEEDFGLVAFEYTEQVSGQTPLPLAGMVEQLPRIYQLAPDIDDAIKRQRSQLRRIGPINPEAQAEYKSVKERFNFMTEQVADLKKAEVDIHEVIQELDSLMQRDFSKTFSAVATEFKTIFQRLFGGGSARLVLTDADNMAETGIEIEARLPGRRTQGLSLLSGGERSLTATSLIFALMKVAPTPFCVLDEVDAMLDEANVGRFRELLQELSQKTQFIIVTHNRNTVQAADIIYGVTMGRDSASQVVSLKMDQVSRVFEG